MYLRGRSVPLRRSRSRSLWRIIFLLAGLAGALIFLSLQQQGAVQVQDPFAPTPTPTRSPLSWAEEARAQFAAGNFKAAITAYENALAIALQNRERGPQVNVQAEDYLVGLARVLIFDQQYEKALERAGQAILVAPDSPRPRAIQAWALRELGRTDEAQAAATQAIGLDPNYAPAHAYYSLILNDQLNTDQGFQEAQTALRLDPTLIETHLALGYSNEVVGNYEGAIKRYQDAIAINPNVIELYRKVALNYRALALRAETKALAQAHFEQSILYFNRALSLNPNNVIPYLDLARTNIQIDRLGVAQQYLERALALEPQNPLIHGRLGLLYFKRKNYESAQPALELAILGGDYTYETGITTTQTVRVEPLPLNRTSLEFYYTYGNLLAFNFKCGPNEALYYLGLALNYAPDDVTVQNSYNESSVICQRYLAGLAPAGAEPAGTPTPRP
jgi:tetratricopeptide (TPR) repeat protein